MPANTLYLGRWCSRALPALGGGVVRDLLLQRQPLGVVRNPVIVLTVLATVMLGMAAIKIMSLTGAQRVARSLQARRHLGTHLIETFDALGLKLVRHRQSAFL
jgi:polar amino acid transport system substrate-binding protein